MKRLIPLLIAVWLAASLAVRVVGLDRSPVSLLFDEAGLGYNAFSLLHTGKDERGNVLPVNIVSLDFKPAIYSYLTVPFIKVWGLTQTTTRLVSAVSGTLVLVFLLALFKKLTRVSWFAAIGIVAFLSFLPWHLHFSRVAFEPNMSALFFVGCVWFLLEWQKRPTWKHFIPLFFFSGLAIYSYNGSRLALPILFFLMITDPFSLVSVGEIKSRLLSCFRRYWPLALVLLLYVPLLASNSGKWLSERFEETNIFANYPFASGPAHPVYYFASSLLGHIQSYVSPYNLATGDYPWVTGSPQGISGTGVFGWLGGLLLILGIWRWLTRFPNERSNRVLAYWILAAIFPAVVTKDWFHPLRATNALLGLEILVGWGILQAWAMSQNKSRLVKTGLLGLGILIGVWSAVYNINNELNFGAGTTGGEFQPGGYKEGAALLNELKDKYQTVYLDSPHTQNYILFVTYLNYPPEKIQAYATNRPPPNFNGDSNFNFDNFIYRKYDIAIIRTEKNLVFWTSSEVKDAEVNAIPGTSINKIYNALGYQAATIITKE